MMGKIKDFPETPAAMREQRAAEAKRFDDRLNSNSPDYDTSSLPQWFELHEWRMYEAIPLILNCDPDLAGVLFEDPFPFGFEIMADYPNLRDYDYDLRKPDPEFTDELRFKTFIEARQKYQYSRLSKILDRNVRRYPKTPAEWIRFAHKYGVEVPWLDWAIEKGLVDPASLEEQEPREEQPLRTNKRRTQSESVETTERREQEIAELRQEANKVATKLKRDGIHKKFITVKRVCEELLDKEFSDGRPFTSRWGTVDGMRSYLKGENNPTRTEEFRKAKSNRGNFNQ